MRHWKPVPRPINEMNSKLEAEGFIAFCRKTAFDCPHPFRTKERTSWMEGYKKAKDFYETASKYRVMSLDDFLREVVAGTFSNQDKLKLYLFGEKLQ